MIYSQAAGYLASGQSNSGTGNQPIADTRNAPNYGYLVYAATTPSAIFKIQASHDTTGWLDVATYTATPTTGTAQQAGYYPYLRAVVNTALGGGGATGSAFVFFAPGVK